jgi:Raf kinase inhibitor-like YbhB/YbcL family protein
MKLTSSAFAHGQPIPRRFTGEGDDVSPQLSWSDVPAGTQELCLLCDDPDAPRAEPWVHWLIAGMAANRTGLAESEAKGLVFGRNDFGNADWGGPMPPPGHGVHHYHFRLFALKAPSGLKAGFNKSQLLASIDGKMLAEAVLTGTYERP